jgi:asparagine synthetase B (glutamine-hydrolysing)
MCGIAGVFAYREPDRLISREIVRRITNALSHREPDGEGIFTDGPVGPGNRRLSIVDLAETGAQPMWTLDRRAVMSYNGEFYNHAEFRPKLEARGVRFCGRSDTETLLYLLAEYGPDALRDVAGIFGLAFWDKRARRLLLARDPIGVKQVCFNDDGKRVASRWMKGRESLVARPDWPLPAAESPARSGRARVCGNLLKQLEPQILVRLVRSAAAGTDWARRYFNNFASVSEATWLRVFSSQEVLSRSRVRDTFKTGIEANPAADPATRLMHWDVRTYLPGLFWQDDRMSMANSLESRVPLADPRVVRVAFHIPFEWKFRAGASKCSVGARLASSNSGERLSCGLKVAAERPMGSETRAPSGIQGVPARHSGGRSVADPLGRNPRDYVGLAGSSSESETRISGRG